LSIIYSRSTDENLSSLTEIQLMRYILLPMITLFLSCSSGRIDKDHDEVISEIYSFQDELNNFYKDPNTSPLRSEAVSFKKHKFFPINLKYRVEAIVERLENEPFFEIPTSGSLTPE